ncbi:amidohydrolase family protein [Bacillus sp. DTU_2020_1000418_1_SI_GHA_SEK_038]|uniref:amidohydrolase family protein n=1 Tax=Bacillus sp. DTU_2020_1000418_1_SI_GHA_SEK_038 TaxID=3077585 RepID=UPI0028EB64B6|nr:amidohydrolase family protein [Bacillus sp. DTU_2020_1000418_1_SI_GHA_SEK_038]WNS76421.1 amidohydrolase family protein [Bacillus sp. DTU_2020_1000418_1_SI_GHA_SEK_038]
MIVDCHFHADESMLTLVKMIEGMDKNDVTKTALIAPMNETMFEVESTFQNYLQHFSRFLILNAPKIGFKIYDDLVKDGFFKLYGNSYKIFTKPNNAIVSAAIDRFPDRFMGWVAVNPMIHVSVEEIELYLNKPGFIGVKAHPFMHEYSIRALDQVAAMCESKGIPMIIHLSSETDSYKYLPEKYPKLKLIYAHAGLPFWKSLWKYAKDQPNVFVDTSSDYLNPSIVKKAVESLGYRKVLYGCDGPYGMRKFNTYDYSEKKRWIDSLQIPDNQKEYILGKNFLELID